MTDPNLDTAGAAVFRPLPAIVALGGIQVLTMLAALARTKIVAVSLGPSGVGIAGVVDQVVSLAVQLGAISIPYAMLKFLPGARGEGVREQQLIYASLMRLLLAASVAVTAAAVGVAWFAPAWLGEGLAPYRGVTFLGLLSCPALALVAAMRNTVAASQRDRVAALFTLGGALALVATSFVGVTLAGLPGLFVGNLVAQGGIALATDRYLRRAAGLRVFGTSAIPIRTLVRERPELLSFAGAMYALAVASPVAYLVSRSLVLNRFGAEATGLMTAAYGLAVSVRLVLNQAGTLHLTPHLNQRTPAADRAAAATEFARVLTILTTVAGVVLVSFPAVWISILYSRQFTPAVPLLAFFVVSESLLLLAGVFQAMLVGLDDIRGHVACTFAAHITIILLAFVFIPSRGALGVPLAFAGGHTLLLVTCGLRLAVKHRFTHLLRAAFLIALAMLMLWTLGWAVATNLVAAAWLRAGIAAGVSIILVALLRPAERRWILTPFLPRRML